MFCIDFTDSTVDGSVYISRGTQQTFSYGFSPNNLSQTAAPGSTISVSKGSRLYLLGNDTVTRLFDSITSGGQAWTITGDNVKLTGNINYLLGNPDIQTLGAYAFGYLFRLNDSIVDASKLVLPSVGMAYYCYYRMFQSCTNLTNTPELPATTMAPYCYEGMFQSCHSLTTAPELPATTLADDCYFEMFDSCRSLTIAPKLPATTFALSCYGYMFQNCTSLVSAPELLAPTLGQTCYYYMFDGCTSLNYVKCLATDVSARSCTYNWLRNVSSTGTFVKASSMNGWSTGTAGIPSGWTIVNA